MAISEKTKHEIRMVLQSERDVGKAVFYLSEFIDENPGLTSSDVLPIVDSEQIPYFEAVHVFTGKPDYLINGDFEDYLQQAPADVWAEIPFALNHFYNTGRLTKQALNLIKNLFDAVKELERVTFSPDEPLLDSYFVNIFIPLEKLLNANTVGEYELYTFRELLDLLERNPNSAGAQTELVNYYAGCVEPLLDFIREFLRKRGDLV